MFFRVQRKIINFVNKCKKDNISAYAAQSAFFVMLSFIPFLMLFISLIKYTPVTKSMILTLVHQYTPEYLSAFLISIIDEIYAKSIGLISVTAIITIWSAAKGIQYLSNGLNAVYEIEETRNYFFLRLRAILDTLVFLVAVVMSLVLLVFGNSIQDFLNISIPIVASITEYILYFRLLIMFLAFISFFIVLFKVLPNRKATLRSQLPGGVLAAVGWILLSFGFSIYVDYFHGFSMYGSLTTVILIMLWLYFGMYLLLVCGEINNIYEEIWLEKAEKK